MRILVTNDDGVGAPGLESLAVALERCGEVSVAAPERQCSGAGSSLTLYTPLVVRRVDSNGRPSYAISGTPADTVKLAIRELLGGPPDIVVSGINHGLNTGSNILYSGTVAGALEGAMAGIPAFAVSVEAKPNVNFKRISNRAVALIKRLLVRAEAGIVFNINFPANGAKGVRWTRQEPIVYKDVYDRRKDPRGRTYYWIQGTPEAKYHAKSDGNGELPTDAWAVAQGYIAVTPLRRDLTDYSSLRRLADHPKKR